jgi:Fe-S-cluster-containing dehydrogenase component
MNKREFLKDAILFFPAAGVLQALSCQAAAKDPAVPASPAYDPTDHWYGMGVDVDKCIGCNRCVEACKAENGVPDEPFYFRTWVERYSIHSNGETTVECISTKPAPVDQVAPEDPDVVRTFFVPKLCNQCAHPPCVQVCPVGATFQTKDGVVLVDEKRCIGCRYCIQACPYGARYLNPNTRTADKCTFCYHRITKGLLPACVEVCPTEARIFGDLKGKADRLVRFQRANKIAVLKPDLNTEPKVLYADLDGEVR